MTIPSTKHVVIAVPMLLRGGTEVHTLALVRTLVGLECRVTVCCYYEHLDAVVAEFERAGAVVLLQKRKRDIDAPARAGELLSLFVQLRGIFSRLKPDIIHVQYVAPGFVPILAARAMGVSNVVATAHSAGGIAYGPLARKLLRFSASLCTTFICVSKSAGEFWFGACDVYDPLRTGAPPRRCAIYNGVDVKSIQKATTQSARKKARSLRHNGTKSVVGIVGRIVDLKGHEILLRAMKEVCASKPGTILLVVGDGPLRPTLERMAGDFGIEAHIRWLGEKRHQEVFETLAMMDILVAPSLYEGFGLTAAEAMAATLPVVASDVAGLREVVRDGLTGLLVPPGDATRLAESIMRLLEKPQEAKNMGIAGRERAAAAFSLDKFERSYASLYKGLSGMAGDPSIGHGGSK